MKLFSGLAMTSRAHTKNLISSMAMCSLVLRQQHATRMLREEKKKSHEKLRPLFFRGDEEIKKYCQTFRRSMRQA